VHVIIWAEFGNVGGGQTQVWDMVRLWRRHGLSVSVIHSLELPEDYRSLLHDLGCDTYLLGVKDSVDLVPGIHRAVVIGVCHTVFLEKSL